MARGHAVKPAAAPTTATIIESTNSSPERKMTNGIAAATKAPPSVQVVRAVQSIVGITLASCPA